MSDWESCQRFTCYTFEKDANFLSGLEWMKKQHKEPDSKEWLLKAKIFYYNKFIEPFRLEDYVKWKESGEDIDGPHEHKQSAESSNAQELADISKLSIEGNSTETIDNTTKQQEKTAAIKEEQEHRLSSQIHTDNCSGDQVVLASTSPSCSNSVVNEEIVCQDSTTKSELHHDTHSNLKTTDTDSSVVDCDHSEPSAESQSLTFPEVMQYVEKGEQIPGLMELDISPTNEPPSEPIELKKKKPWEV